MNVLASRAQPLLLPQKPLSMPLLMSRKQECVSAIVHKDSVRVLPDQLSYNSSYAFSKRSTFAAVATTMQTHALAQLVVIDSLTTLRPAVTVVAASSRLRGTSSMNSSGTRINAHCSQLFPKNYETSSSSLLSQIARTNRSKV
jgi:hypothetical protein